MIHNTEIPRIPGIAPIPVSVYGCAEPVLCLNGEWEYRSAADAGELSAIPGAEKTESGKNLRKEPADGNSSSSADASPAKGWSKIPVPSSMDKAHIPGYTGFWFCRKTVTVPQCEPGSRFVLRFEGTNAHVDLYVNGRYIRHHDNGMITWNADVTGAVGDAEVMEILLAGDDVSERVSTFNHGGIIHDVYLLVLPPAYLSSFHADAAPVWLPDRTDGSLRIKTSVDGSRPGMKLIFRLTAPDGAAVPVRAGTAGEECSEFSAEIMPGAAGKADARAEGCADEGKVPTGSDGPMVRDYALSVSSPELWDAEHPNLYTLEISLKDGNRTLETVKNRIGFREIRREGNQVFINRREVKLRGTCRHEVTPLNGRSVPKETIRRDVELFKEANINYVRTSHYPPSSYFLDLCDEYGIYVEDELALAFIARTLDYTEQDPRETGRYLSHFAETYARDGSHPCVIIWSLCNESFCGTNFDLLNHFAKQTDPSRLTKFSYPMTMREDYLPVDVWSIHYGNVEDDPSVRRDNVGVGGAFGKTMPVLHDEYVHVPCYNRAEQRRDPGVREFWGKSIARFWDHIWNTKGALGGAIWAGIDETDLYVGGNSTHLEWGIIDLWRRKKPEHTMTRRAYSPVVLRDVNPLTEQIRVEDGETDPPRIVREGDRKAGSDFTLSIPVENRFCHTDLSEGTFSGFFLSRASAGDLSVEACERAAREGRAEGTFRISGPQLPPGGKGRFAVPCRKDADYLYLAYTDSRGRQVSEDLIDLYRFGCGSAETARKEESAEEGNKDACAGELEVKICRKTGRFAEISRNGKILITDGSYLHVPYLQLPDWTVKDISVSLAEAEESGGMLILRNDAESEVTVRGSFGSALSLTWVYRIHCDGRLEISYRADSVAIPMPRKIKLRVGVDCGGLDELGITLVSAEGADQVSWSRRGDYSVYPEDFIDRTRGTARKGSRERPEPFGEPPRHPWKDDVRCEIRNGRYDPGLKGSNDFCSAKENITEAEISSSGDPALCWKVLPVPGAGGQPAAPGETAAAEGRRGESAGSGRSRGLSLRAEGLLRKDRVIPCGDPSLVYQGQWYAMETADRYAGGPERWAEEENASVTCRFWGNGIVWYASVDINYGIAEVFLDGKRMGTVSQKVDGVDFPGSAEGFDRRDNYPVWSADGLPDGEHAMTIRCTGTHEPGSKGNYIAVGYFYVIRNGELQKTAVHLLQARNFPQISWGNWKEQPIRLSAGDEGHFCLKF